MLKWSLLVRNQQLPRADQGTKERVGRKTTSWEKTFKTIMQIVYFAKFKEDTDIF